MSSRTTTITIVHDSPLPMNILAMEWGLFSIRSESLVKPYIIRAAVVDDALKSAPLLREKDKREIAAASGNTPEVSLLLALAGKGEVVTAETTDGDPIIIGGVRPTHPKVGAIWMLGTPLLEQYAIPQMREAKRWIERWHETYPLLWNAAWEDNDLHVRWLSMLGFNFIRRYPHRGHNFIEFAKHV